MIANMAEYAVTLFIAGLFIFSATLVRHRPQKHRIGLLAIVTMLAVFNAGCTSADETQNSTDGRQLVLDIILKVPEKSDEIYTSNDSKYIKEFDKLFEVLLNEEGSGEILVQEKPFNSIPDLYLESDGRRMSLLRRDYSSETGLEIMNDAYYAELYEDSTQEKLLIIPLESKAGRSIAALIENLKTGEPVTSPVSDEDIPLYSSLALIGTAEKNIWCLKEEVFYPADGYALMTYDNEETQKILAGYGEKLSWQTEYMPFVTYQDSLEMLALSTMMTGQIQQFAWIELNPEEKEKLINNLKECHVEMTLENTNTNTVFSMDIPVTVWETEDKTFESSKIPILKNLVRESYFLNLDTSKEDYGIRFTPRMENNELIFSMDFIDNGEKKAADSLRIAPIDPQAWNRLNPVFSAELNRDPALFDDGELHWQFESGTYAVEFRQDSMSIYAVDSQKRIIPDSGIRIEAVNS